jgi:amino acid adenylation domain-containing protein
MLLHAFLEAAARSTPDAVALIDGDRQLSYRELDRLANRFANVLTGSGMKRGDRVAVALENGVEMVAAYFGVLKAGGVAVPLAADPRNDRLPRAIADCRPRVCVLDGGVSDEMAKGAAALSTLLVVGAATAAVLAVSRPVEPLLATASDAAPAVRPIDADLALIVYTSGSTGEPRGVMLTHRNVVANTRSIVRYLQLTERDRVMCILPFHYVYGLSLLHTHVAVGGSVVVDNRFAFPNVVLNAMHSHRVTGLAGVPSTFALLLHRSSLDATPLPDLRYVTQAGGAMPPQRLAEWLKRGPNVPFFVMYGATEASARLTYLDPAELPGRAGSIGRPIPNVEIVVRREDGSPAAAGEIGELVARGSNIARGYWNDPVETARRFDHLGYHTGDMGYADPEGFLYLVGRRHDMIKVGAHRVGAREIEDVISEYPNVHEVAVVAAPHELLGETPIAYVSLRDGETPLNRDALMSFLRDRLPAYKMPQRITVRDELPKIPGIGKIDRMSLRADVVAPSQ